MTSTNSSTRTARLVAAATLCGALAACGTSDAPTSFAPGGEQGRIRFVNVITDTTRGRVNATLEGLPFGVNLTYTLSTPATLPAPNTGIYAAILAGSRTLVLRRTADTNSTVASFQLTIAANADVTVYGTGGAGGTPVTSFLTTDDNVAPSAGQVRVRVVHLSPTAGPVDIFVTAPGADLATATPTLANFAVRTASSYLAVPAGTYQVRVVPAGTAPAARAAAVAINVASLALPAGGVRTIVAADNNIGGAPLRAFVLVDR